jgi:uncharacterized lipoprotein
MMRCLLLALVLLLAACAPSTEYRKAETTEDLKLPEGVPLEGAQPHFRVSEPERRAEWNEDQDKFEAPKPPRVHIPARDQAPEQAEPAERTRVVLARDGNGYPIIMMHTAYAWAWEYVGQALEAAEFRIDDRNRESGIYFIKVPAQYETDAKTAQIKLSHTANGIQIAVLNPKGTALLAKKPGEAMLQRLYEEL